MMEAAESKKLNLEELSKEELVKKCKILFTVAQKAKVSKDALLEEINALKKDLQNGATTELIDTLTNEKLALVTQLEDLKTKYKKVEETNKLLQEQQSLSQEKLTTLDTENTSYKRQVARLTDENEQLISDLSTLETQISELHKLGVEQKAQLLELEKANGSGLDELQSKLSQSLEEVKKLNKNLVAKENEIQSLSQELQALKIVRSSVLDSNKNCDSYIKEINELKLKNESLSQELNDIQATNGKLKDKVSLYHSKLKKFALTTKEIKDQKNEILKFFKLHVEQTNEWKEQLVVASQQLLSVINTLENENKTLKEERKIYLDITSSENDAKDKLETYERELTLLKSDLDVKVQEIISKHEIEVKEINTNLQEYKAKESALLEELSLKTNILEEAIKRETILEEANQKLSNSYHSLQDQVNALIQQLKVQEDLKCTHENKMQLLQNALAVNQEKVNKLNEALQKSTDTEKRLAEESSEEILRLAQNNKELGQLVAELQAKLHAVEGKTFTDTFVQTIVEDSHSSEDNGIDLKRENSELLLEMNQMNQALKERGEIISQLESHCEEIKKKLQLYESQANKNVDSITEKDETIKALQTELEMIKQQNSCDQNDLVASKNAEIANLKAELTALKDNSYAESETMSTSTISRSEEVNRLKDLEGSWEERYGKLRNLAIKLKGKIKEHNNTINNLEKEKDDLLKKQSSSVKTIQSLQAQIDKLQDDLELVNSENKQYVSKLNTVAQNISKDKQLLVENEETISKLRKELETVLSDKQAVENWKKQVGAKVQTLRKELEAKTLLYKESESKVSKLEAELENITTQLKNEQENHKQTKTLLEQSSTECKKNSVLNLEMQDYERSVKELSQKLEKQSSEISTLQTQLDLQKNTVNALREQNKTLEDRIQEAEKSENTTSLEIDSFKKTISNLENILQQKENKISDVTKLLETVRFENEELSTELSKVIAEHQKSLSLIKSERDQLRNQLIGLQQNLRDCQNQLTLREDELAAIKGDYESYKVRAQSVLKKNQNRDLGQEEKLVEEVSSLKAEVETLNEELKLIRDKLQIEETTNQQFISEKDSLLKQSYEAKLEIEELKNLNEQLGIKHQKALSEQAETIRSLKVHAETLSQCYRQQLAEQEVRHNREIIELQSRIDKSPSPEPVHLSMPREEGEGSESVESNPTPNNVHPIPLERLLDSKSEDEAMHLKKSLLEQESKVTHLTALLSDAEQDLAKHVQMNKVLKEEIRRQQRSVEREKHAENLEYLKNVVFKVSHLFCIIR